LNTASNIFNAATGLDRQKFDINVSGTIKLEGNGKSVDLDIDKLIENPEFVRKLADVINSRTNVSVNGGKKKAENARNQTAKIFN
jgi:DNA-binding protein YbaB